MPYKDPERRREYEKMRKRKKKIEANGGTVVTAAPPSTRRVCATEDCNTVLSMYNSDNYCSIHERAINLSSTNLHKFLTRY